MSATTALRKLRQQHQALLQIEEERNSKQQEKEIDEALQRANNLLWYTYNSLAEKVHSACGIPDQVELFLGMTNGLDYISSSQLTIIQRHFQAKSGLQIAKSQQNSSYIILDLTGEAKAPILIVDNKRTTLDFPALIAENKCRQEAWKNHLPETAKHFVDICKDCLETMPGRHYGIPEKQTILSYKDAHASRSNGCTPFVGTFPVHEYTVKYSELTSEQLAELAKTMNLLVAHGDISCDNFNIMSNVLWIYITRRPDKEVEHAYFDYAEFCAHYDEVTPELQEVFDRIVSQAVPIVATKQIASLTPQRQLIYCLTKGDGIDFKLLKQSEPIHTQHLANALRQYLPGVTRCTAQVLNKESTFVSPRGCAHSTTSTDERVEFTIDFDSTSSNDILVYQRAIEALIHHVKKWRVQYVANSIIKQAVADFQAHHNSRAGLSERRLTFKLRDAQFTVTLNHYIIDRVRTIIADYAKEVPSQSDIEPLIVNLAEVADDEFRQRAETAVLRQSSGMLSVNIAESKYEFHFS